MPRIVPALAFLSCAVLASPFAASAAPSPPRSPGACTGDAVVLLLDKSGSMTGAPLEKAKEGAKRMAAKLGQNDCFEVVTFDSSPSRTVTLGPVYDRDMIESAIDAVTAGGGTEIFSPLSVAFTDLSVAKKAKRKSVILLTDGQAPKKGIEELATAMAREKIRVSTIGLGGSTDEATLRMIADKTGGHMRLVKTAADLPKELDDELAALRP